MVSGFVSQKKLMGCVRKHRLASGLQGEVGNQSTLKPPFVTLWPMRDHDCSRSKFVANFHEFVNEASRAPADGFSGQTRISREAKRSGLVFAYVWSGRFSHQARSDRYPEESSRLCTVCP